MARGRSASSLRTALAVILVACFAALAPLASTAQAAPCTSTWNGGDGAWETPANWTPSGVPLTTDDVCIEANGTYAVSISTSHQVASLAVGSTTTSGTQTLSISGAGLNTSLRADNGVTNGTRGAIVLGCPALGCVGAAPTIDVRASTLSSAGAMTVTALAAGMGGFIGNVTNTGTITVAGDTRHAAGTGPTTTLLNQGTIAMATGVVLTSGASCADTGTSVSNATSGRINATGTGTLSVVNYVQGAGTTSGANPVTMSCGTLAYTSAGASRVLVTGGIALSGASHAGQVLTITAASPATSAVATAGFTNGGAITLDCPSIGCAGGPPTLAVGASTLVNTGSITLTAAAGGTGGLTGNVANSGSLRFDGNARLAAGGGAATTFTQSAGLTTVASGVTFDLGPSASAFNLAGGTLNGGGTIGASVSNSGGLVGGGPAPATLTIAGDYAQGPAASLGIVIDGTAAGRFSKLVVGGKATLQGGLRLTPTQGYVNAATAGDSVALLTSGGALTGAFANTSVAPLLAAGRALTGTANAAARRVDAVVSGGPSPAGPGGSPPGPGGAAPAAATAPRLSRLSLSPAAFKAAKGTTLKVDVSRAATITVVITRRLHGRRVGARCKLKASKGRRCILTVTHATLKLKAVKGVNRLKLRTTRLGPGRYTATITAKATTGKASKPLRVSFTVK